MIITTTDTIPGRQLEVIGSVRGNVAYAKNIGRDIMASFKNLAGGEVKSYTMLVAESRDIAEQRMADDARAKGADAIVGARLQTASVAEGIIEVVSYGTAVRFI